MSDVVSAIMANVAKFKKNINPQAKYLKLVILILPLLVVVYLGLSWYRAATYTTTAQIDFRPENFKNLSLPLYINEPSNSPKFSSLEKIEEQTIATVQGSPITFVFQPKEFPLKKTITASMQLKDEGDWEISLICPNCDKKEKYNWQPFYYGRLRNYTLAQTIGNINIYTKEEKQFAIVETVAEWLAKNVPLETTVEIQNNVLPLSEIVNPDIDYLENSSTTIDKTFRGNHDFYVYLKDKLEMNVIKKDLNYYEGKDDVIISLYDLNDKLIGKTIIIDDGIENKSTEFAPVLKEDIEYDVPQPGVYKLSFEEISQELAKSDWIITNFKINTNKIILSNSKPTLFLQPVTLYTEIAQPQEISINIWQKAQIQTTKITSTKYILQNESTENDINLTQTIKLAPENYEISYQGHQKVGGAYFALNKNNFFKLYKYNLNFSDSPSVVITDYSFKIIGDEWIEVSKKFQPNELKKLSDAKTISFQLSNSKLFTQFINENSLYEKGYTSLGQFNQYKLFGNKDLKNNNVLAPDLISWLKESIPQGDKLKIPSTLTLDKNAFKSDGGKTATQLISIADPDETDFDFILLETFNTSPIKFMNLKINVE